MEKPLKWTMELLDRVSPATRAIQRALGRAGRSLRQTARDMGVLAGVVNILAGQKLRQLPGLLGNILKAIPGQAAAGAWDLFKWGARGAAMAVGAAFVSMAAASAGFALKVLGDSDRAKLAFSTFVGPEQADAVQGQILKMADFYGKSVSGLEDQMGKLMASGFSTIDSSTLMQAAFDMQGMGSDSNQIIETYAQIRAAGHLTTQDLKQLGITGRVGMGRMYEELAKIRGFDTKDAAGVRRVQKLIESGGITSEEAIRASLSAVQQLTKRGIGEYAKDASKSFNGMVERAKNLPEQLMRSADLAPMRDALAGAMGAVLDLLNPKADTGKVVIGAITNMSKSIAAFIGKPERVKAGVISLIGAFRTIGSVVGFVFNHWKLFAGALVAFQAINIGIAVAGIVSALWGMGAALAGVGVAGILAFWWVGLIAVAVGAIWYLVANWDTAWPAIQRTAVAAWEGLKAFFWGAVGWFRELGSNLVQGLKEGFQDAWGNFMQSMKDIFIGYPKKIREWLGIHSPSTVFMQIGTYSVLGLQRGFEQGEAPLRSAVASTVDASIPDPPSVRASAPMPLASVQSGGNVVNVYLEPREGEQAKDLGDRIGEAVMDALVRVVSQANAQQVAVT